MASVLDQATANVRRRRRRALRRWLERHPTARVAARGGRWAWRRRDRVAAAARWTGRGFKATEANAIDCGYCGRSVPVADAEQHIERHNRAAERDANRSDSRQSATRRKPSPRPRPTTDPAPARPAPRPTASTGRNATVATQETIALARAARTIGEMDPRTAWDLDAELAGMATAMLTLAENVGQWVERLDVMRVDPRVTGPTADAIAQLAEASGTFSRSRLIFRRLYAAQFEAAETNVRQIRRDDFWNQQAA
ncbi:hypothetical protein Aph02nite_50100 [Actinoplanes philippinensis]|uniref:Uncharacterized protein n=1 Tax=Actinoplanes philippinensis TaxID=35752 RepID=A0A1I2IQL6_9ACTN|nr:hypothetical protein [Actinoplanes philippinensis]GIE79060.1 hypothetical protein Aph02nite_50100 [Actinoplanes philippinensis]SFF44554.1 hypothetical protein SAMN05421541_110353 [Actinoplanes philippinensis]